MKKPIGQLELTIQLYRMDRKENALTGGVTHTRVEAGTRTGTVELRIDVDKLLRQLGAKALGAKTRRTRLASGMIEVHVVKERV